MKKPNFQWVGTWILPRVHLIMCCVMMLGATSMLAQTTVTGKITDSNDNAPMEGVIVKQKGTSTGAISGSDGSFAIKVEGNIPVLVFSFIGYNDMEMAVDGKSNLTVAMDPGWVETEEQVITALGISRDKKALGYAVTEVEGESFQRARETNLGNALAGKVAGVNVASPATGAAGSSRITIRGNSTLTGNNQPLIVIDGIPIDNSNLGSASMWGGSDQGDGLSSINPDDIEKVTVLKGSAATALYGARGSNGVILVTSKSGASRKGIGVSYNGNVTFESALQLQDWQTEYGHGRNGLKPTSEAIAFEQGLYSWGGKLDGSNVVQFDGVERPYSAVDNNQGNFYRTGRTFNNTVALSGGNDLANFRLSLSNLNNQDIMPNAGMNRNNVNFNTNGKFGKLSASVNGTYSRQTVNNRPRLSDSPGNANFAVGLLPPSIDVLDLQGDPDKLGADPETGEELQFQNNVFTTNPYWAAHQFDLDEVKDRIYGMTSLKYDFTDWLFLQGRVGIDRYNRKQTNIDMPYGTAYDPNGRIFETTLEREETNIDLMLNANKTFGDFGINAFVGGNRMSNFRRAVNITGNRMSIPFKHSVELAENKVAGYEFEERAIRSVFGSAQFSFKNYAFLTVTGRNDWFSVLTPPVGYEDLEGTNSIFYPSVSAGFVLSDAVAMPSLFDYFKVRGGWGVTANEAAVSPYQLTPTYALVGNGHLGQPIGRISTGTIPPSGPQPPLVTEWEVGLDVRMLENRIGVDMAYYHKVTEEDILSATISPTSGFGSRFTRVGSMTNEGIEALINIVPVRTRDFTYDFSINISKNWNVVDSLAPELTDIRQDESRTRNAYIHHYAGLPYSQIAGFPYARDDGGNILYDADNRPMQGEFGALANGVHDFIVGFNNRFRYKSFTLEFLIDMKTGGNIYNATNAYGYSFGLHQNTLVGREDGNVGPFQFTDQADVEAYYQSHAFRITEEFVQDADFAKLRQLVLGYDLPQDLLVNSPFDGVSVSFVGRNLFLLWSKTDNIDPESTYTNGNAQGLEMFGVPQVRSYGINLNVRF